MAHPQDSERFQRLEHQRAMREDLAAEERRRDAEKNAKIKDLLDNGPKHAKPKGKHRKDR